MTLRERLAAMLESPDPIHQAHARFRLGLLDSGDDPPLVRLSVFTTLAENRTIRACPHIDVHCGCDLPTCNAGKGNHDDGAKASRDHCLMCLRQSGVEI